jgi:hypothetical protein
MASARLEAVEVVEVGAGDMQSFDTLLCLSKQPHLACEVGLHSGFFSKELLLDAPDGIGADEAITPEPQNRNNWTKVSARLWYRIAAVQSLYLARNQDQSIVK